MEAAAATRAAAAAAEATRVEMEGKKKEKKEKNWPKTLCKNPQMSRGRGVRECTLWGLSGVRDIPP